MRDVRGNRPDIVSANDAPHVNLRDVKLPPYRDNAQQRRLRDGHLSGPEIPFRNFHRGVAEQTRAAYSLRVSACWRRLSVCDNQEASEITEPWRAA